MSNTRFKCSSEDRRELQAFLHFVFFEEWEGLKEAIRNGMGGKCLETVRGKQNTLVETISNLCCSPSTDVEEIEQKLEDLIDTLFSTWFEDDSVEEVASLIYNYSRNLLAGDVESLRSYVATRSKSKPPVCRIPVIDSDDEMETDTAAEVLNSSNEKVSKSISSIAVTSEEAADGWEVPKYSRRRH